MNIPKLCEKIVFDFYNRSKITMCTRFIDSADLNRESYKRGAKFTATGIVQPSDLLVTCEGTTFYAEVKSTDNERGVTQSLIKRQAGSRRRVLTAGGMYLYYIYRINKRQWYEVPGDMFQEQQEGTILWEDLEDCKIDFLKGI